MTANAAVNIQGRRHIRLKNMFSSWWSMIFVRGAAVVRLLLHVVASDGALVSAAWKLVDPVHNGRPGLEVSKRYRGRHVCVLKRVEDAQPCEYDSQSTTLGEITQSAQYLRGSARFKVSRIDEHDSTAADGTTWQKCLEYKTQSNSSTLRCIAAAQPHRRSLER